MNRNRDGGKRQRKLEEDKKYIERVREREKEIATERETERE